MIDLSVVILSWNTRKLLQTCLTSIFTQTRNINFEVIVVDNGSSDGSVKMVKEKFFAKGGLARGRLQVTLIENKTNLGFAKANNQGIKKARGTYLLLLNSDTKLEENSLAKLVDFARTKADLAIVGPKLINPGNLTQKSAAPFYTLEVVLLSLLGADRWLRRTPQKACRVDWVEGSCFLIKKEVLKKIGLLDEKFFMYAEEMEFCYRAGKAGFQTWYYPGARVFHLVRGSSPEGKQKAIWWIYQGLIYFYQKHFAPGQVAMLKFLLRTKAILAFLTGVLTGNHYLRQTYGKAFKLVR